MKINKLIGVMLIFSCIIMLNGCKKNQYKAYSITYFDYFDTVTTIIGYFWYIELLVHLKYLPQFPKVSL